MKTRPEDHLLAERRKALQEERREILSLPAGKALDRILTASQPAALVHSFPEEELYFLLHDIGPEEGLPLLSLASNRQWEFILDIDTWEKDRVDLDATFRWLDRLLRADSERLAKWLLKEKTEKFEFFLNKCIAVRILEHDEDPSDFGDSFFTFDSSYYIRVLPAPPGPDADEKTRKDRETFLSQILERVAGVDHVLFQSLLTESAGLIPAELEEESYRRRNVRLAEKGFLPFDEAIGVYQSVSPGEFHRQAKKSARRTSETPFPVPLYSTTMLEGENLFIRALKSISSHSALADMQVEFAGLCNRIISADGQTVREKDRLKAVVQKASGYIGLGLEKLVEAAPAEAISRAAVLIQDYPLIQIFRVGYGLALDLKWRAQRWKKESWAERSGFPLSFWGEAWVGVLGGLLVPKPLFFDNYATGVLYREFSCLDDIQETGAILDTIVGVDTLMSLMDIEPNFRPGRVITFQNLLLTLWARSELGLGEAADGSKTYPLLPLPLFRSFFQRLFEGDGAGKIGKIPDRMKTDFLEWLSKRTPLSAAEISERLGNALEGLFLDIEAELGAVSSHHLDPRYITLFLVGLK